jgi:hypothetical protein
VMILTLIHRSLLQEVVRETSEVVDDIDDETEISDDEVMLG